MTDKVSAGKRNFLKTAMLGTASGALAGTVAPDPALAQMLETNIREDSVLAKIRREGVINVGYAQTGPWFYKDAKSGELGGIYKDVVDMLAKEIQIKVESIIESCRQAVATKTPGGENRDQSAFDYPRSKQSVCDPC